MTQAPEGRQVRKRRGWKIAAICLGVIVVIIAALLVGYVDMNTHYYERDMATVKEAGVVEKRTTVEGYAVNYAEGPDNGPPLLLIHGQGSQWQDYAKVIPELAARYHIFAIDVFGHGASARLPAAEYTNVRVGSLIAKFMQQVIGEPAVVSGHSSGALLTTWIAAHRPELVTGVVLEDPPFYSSIMPRAAKTTGGQLMILTHRYLKEGGGTDFQRYFLEHGNYFSFFGGLEPKIVDYSLSYLDKNPGKPLEVFFLPPSMNVFFRGLVNYDPAFGAAWYDNQWYSGFDTDASLAAIKCPVVLIHTNFWHQQHGTYYSDEGVLMAAMDDRDLDRTLAQLRDPELIEVSSGHLVHFEKPAEYLKAVAALEARVGA